MTLRRIAIYLITFIAVALIFKWGLSPLRTRLPDGSDLTTVEPKLQRLTVDEQKLVRDYVIRSKGEYVPTPSNEPDAPPLTARTFGDAIKLQRRFIAMLESSRAETKVRDAKRAATLAPFRAVLRLELVRRELADFGGMYGHPSGPRDPATPPLPGEDLQALTVWRIHNLSSRVVASFEGNAQVYGDGPGILHPHLSISGCYIEHDAPLPPRGSLHVACGRGNRGLAADRAYLAVPASALTIDWTPRRITYADGSELKYDGD